MQRAWTYRRSRLFLQVRRTSGSCRLREVRVVYALMSFEQPLIWFDSATRSAHGGWIRCLLSTAPGLSSRLLLEKVRRSTLDSAGWLWMCHFFLDTNEQYYSISYCSVRIMYTRRCSTMVLRCIQVYMCVYTCVYTRLSRTGWLSRNCTLEIMSLYILEIVAISISLHL